jgi:hypothetical protein
MTALRALWRWLRIGLLRYQIYETEAWLAACAEDGLLDGVCLRYIRADLDQMRVELYALGGGTR